MPEQTPFGGTNFSQTDWFPDPGIAKNPEPRVPCILLLDTSGSMEGRPIQQLNEGITTFRNELVSDSLGAKRAEVAIVTFGGEVRTLCDFTTALDFNPPFLTSGGQTPMGAAIVQSVQMLKKRKDQYRANGIFYYRPWLFLVSDGAPTDDWRPGADAIRTGEAQNAFSFFAVGPEMADMDLLRKIAVREPLRLVGLKYREMFLWLTKSLHAVSGSRPGENVSLQNPAAPGGWASV